MEKKATNQTEYDTSTITPKEFLNYFKDHKVVKAKCMVEA